MVWIGLFLMVLGAVLLIVEAHVVSFGVLGTTGVLAIAGGAGTLVRSAGAPLGVVIPLVVVLALVGAGFLVLAARKVLASRRLELQSGPQRLSGLAGVVRTWTDGNGQVAADGSLWSARTIFGWDGSPPAPGEAVVIDRLDGLTLLVRRPNAWERDPVCKPSELSL